MASPAAVPQPDLVAYAQKFAALQAKLGTGPDWQAFLQNPQPQLQAAGIPTLNYTEPPSAADFAAAAAAQGDQLTVVSKWWGQDWVLNEKLTSDVVTGLEGLGALTEVIGGALGCGAVIAAGIAAAFIVQITEIKIADNGNGVYYPVTWLQWAALAEGVTLGPSGVCTAALVFLFPLRNS